MKVNKFVLDIVSNEPPLIRIHSVDIVIRLHFSRRNNSRELKLERYFVASTKRERPQFQRLRNRQPERFRGGFKGWKEGCSNTMTARGECEGKNESSRLSNRTIPHAKYFEFLHHFTSFVASIYLKTSLHFCSKKVVSTWRVLCLYCLEIQTSKGPKTQRLTRKFSGSFVQNADN